MAKQAKRQLAGSGEALPAGAIGEVVSGSTATTAIPVFNNNAIICQITIPAGVWNFSYGFQTTNTTAVTPAKFTTSIGKVSGNGAVYNATVQAPSPGVSTATTPGSTELVGTGILQSDGTLVIAIYCGHYANSSTGTLAVLGSSVGWHRVRIA